MEKMFDILNGRFCEVIMKHDGSRFVQTMLKYGYG